MEEKSFRDLIDIIHFTEQVAASIQSLSSESDIYKSVMIQFRKSKRYTASIVLLTEDGNHLRIMQTSLHPTSKLIKNAEKTAHTRMNTYTIDLEKSSIYRKVVQKGETLHVRVGDIVTELFPRIVAFTIVKILKYDKAYSILTPLKKHNRIIGALAMSAPTLAEYFIPSVKNLSYCISSALELSDEIASREKMEKEITELNRTLEQRVLEKTRELRSAEERLRQSEKMEAIGYLAGGIAHDFNNQLAGIMGCADLLRAGLTDNTSLYELADMIVVAAGRSSELTKQLLAFARKGKLQSIQIDIHRTINEVVAILERSIGKKINLHQHLKAHLTTVQGDPAQIESAFLNLALNAGDAMPNGGDLIFITNNVTIDKKRAKTLAVEPGTYIEITIADTGIGIDETIQKRIFEPFFTTKAKGTGMGLAAVYGIITNHKGTIDVKSNVGKGSIFTLYLPVSERDASTSAKYARQAVPKISGKILVIDDENLVLNTTARILTQHGYEVITCTGGHEAVELYKKSFDQIGCVILDIIMPEMDGREVFRAMKKISPRVKVLFSSGYSMDREVRTIVQKGGAEFIQKPFQVDHLFERISRLMGE